MSKQRLIDANALREYWHISEKCEDCHWYNRDCTKPPYYSLRDICEAIDEVPTIPAIPLDWLREKMDGYAAKLRSTELAALVTVMNMWEREQEGR